MDFDQANLKRDRRLRRRLLFVLHLARRTSPTGGLIGRELVDQVEGAAPPGQGFEDDAHAMGLCRDLVNKGLAEEKPLERRKGHRFGLDYTSFRITAKGSSLQQETIPPDPDIDDDRITPEGQD